MHCTRSNVAICTSAALKNRFKQDAVCLCGSKAVKKYTAVVATRRRSEESMNSQSNASYMRRRSCVLSRASNEDRRTRLGQVRGSTGREVAFDAINNPGLRREGPWWHQGEGHVRCSTREIPSLSVSETLVGVICNCQQLPSVRLRKCRQTSKSLPLCEGCSPCPFFVRPGPGWRPTSSLPEHSPSLPKMVAQ